MKILAVDTALGACSAAVVADDRAVAQSRQVMQQGHAEALAPMVAQVMREANLAFEELDRLAVTTGPGTFTGQRIGLAFMRGLRLALGRPLTGVTTLEAMALAGAAETGLAAVAVVHEARRGEVYAALVADGALLLSVQLAEFGLMMDKISAATDPNKPLAFAGTAAEVAARRHRDLGGRAVLCSVRQPDAQWVARLAAARSLNDAPVNPLYLRAPDAKLPAAAAAISLRSAQPRDASLLAELGARIPQLGWDADFLGRFLAAPEAIGVIAERGGEAAGFGLARAAAGEAELLAIGVATAYRRKGLGGLLLRKVADTAHRRGAETLFLEVATDNEAALKLYRAHKFAPVGRRKSYYGQGVDALVLRAPLPLARLGNAPDLA